MDIILKIVLGLFALGIVYLLGGIGISFFSAGGRPIFSRRFRGVYWGTGSGLFRAITGKAEQENDYVLAIRVNYSALLQMLDKER